MNNRVYVNSTSTARKEVERIVKLVTSDAVRPLIAYDLETSPIAGLEGYPGTQYDEDGNPISAKKKQYLEFTQQLWKASFDPVSLRRLGIYIPKKTTSGKEGLVSAQDAWLAALTAAEAVTHEQLEAARWTERDLAFYLDNLRLDRRILVDQQTALLTVEDAPVLKQAVEALFVELPDLRDVFPAKGIGKAAVERARKRLTAQITAIDEEVAFLERYAIERLDKPVDVRLLLHILRVGVQSRIGINPKSKGNRLDPVRPGLDPFTSDIFLAQISLQTPEGELFSWIFNILKVDFAVLAPVLRLEVPFIGANIKFDLKLTYQRLGFAPENTFCTRVASRMLFLGLLYDHSLAGTYKRFCGKELSKEARNTFVGKRYEEPTEEQLEYAYLDTEILFELFDAMIAKAQSTDQEELVWIFSRLSYITAVWEVEGYELDVAKWNEIAAGAIKDRNAIAREIEGLLLPDEYAALLEAEAEEAEEAAEGDEDETEDDSDESSTAKDTRKNALVNLGSTKTVATLLAPKLGVEEITSLAKDPRSTLDREYRARNGGKAHPFFALYEQWQKRNKQTSTYGRKFLWYLHPLTGKVHPTFQIAGTDTGRYSSTEPNMLNIPAAKEPGDPDFRSAFVAPDGFYLIGADYDNMEFRIGGDLAQDPVILSMVESNVDGHSFTAAQMFHIRQADVTEPVERQGVYQRGAKEIQITMFDVPKEWTPRQIADFAAKPFVEKAVKATEGKLTRSDAKAVTFRWQFRGGPWGLAEKTGMSLEFCQDLMSRFVEVYKKTDDFLNETSNRVYTHTFVGADGATYAFSEGYGGIRRYTRLPKNPFRGDFSSYEGYYQAAKTYKYELSKCMRHLANLPMQGSNAVVTAEALLYIHERGKRYGIRPWLAIYDEIIITAPMKIKPIIAKGILESSMNDAGDRYMRYVPCGAEADLSKSGKYWKKS